MVAVDAVRVVVESLQDGVGTIVPVLQLGVGGVDADVDVRCFLQGRRQVDVLVRRDTRRRWSDRVHRLLEVPDQRGGRRQWRPGRVVDDEVAGESQRRSHQELGG